MMKYGKPVLICAGLGIAISAVILLLFSVLMSAKDVPQMLISPMTILALCVGTLVASVMCARLVGRRGMMMGMLCAGLMFLLILVVGAVATREGIGFLALVKLFAMLLCGAIGGILGVNTKKRRG